MKASQIKKNWKYLQEIKGDDPTKCTNRVEGQLADILNLTEEGVARICAHNVDIWVSFTNRAGNWEIIKNYAQFKKLYE